MESANSTIEMNGIKQIIHEIIRAKDVTDYNIVIKKDPFTGDNYLGDISRIKINSHKSNKNKTIELIMKKAPPSATTRDAFPITNLYKNEIFMYNSVFPALKKVQEDCNIPVNERLAFAKLFKATSEEFKEFLILNDLSVDGFTMYDKRLPLDVEHTSLALQNMARMHAASFAIKEKTPELFNELLENLPQTINYGDRMPQYAQQSIEMVLPAIKSSVNRSKIAYFTTNFGEIIQNALDAKLSAPYNTICHGDCWNNNMLFKYKNGRAAEVIFIDWQLSRFASPVTDISYLLLMSLDEDLLNGHFEDLLNLYYSTLELSMKALGCDVSVCYPKDVFESQCKKKMVLGLIMALCIIPSTLSDPGDAKSIEELVGELNSGVNSVSVGKLAATRLNGVVNFCVNGDYV